MVEHNHGCESTCAWAILAMVWTLKDILRPQQEQIDLMHVLLEVVFLNHVGEVVESSLKLGRLGFANPSPFRSMLGSDQPHLLSTPSHKDWDAHPSAAALIRPWAISGFPEFILGGVQQTPPDTCIAAEIQSASDYVSTDRKQEDRSNSLPASRIRRYVPCS